MVMVINKTLDITEVLDVYSKMNKSKRDKYLALNDCIFFGERYIKPFDSKWDSETAEFHYEMIDALETEEFVQIHVPFDHAKTTWISIVYPIWLIVKDTNVSILLISSTPKLVQKCLAVISWHLLNNKILLKDFPYIKKDEEIEKWTDSQIYVKRKIIKKDPTVEVVGMGGAILGGKFKKIIGDDVCDRNNMNTLALRDKATNWWLEDVHSRLEPGGGIANVGTLQHPDDLGMRLKANKQYRYIHHKAIINEDAGEVLWNDRYPLNKLILKRETIGTIRFERTYQNNPASWEGKLLKPEWLHYYKEDEISIPELNIYFGVDPDIADLQQPADKGKNCWFVIAVLGWHKLSNIIYVLQTYYGIHSFPDQVRLLIEFYEIWTPIKIGVESNFYQKALAQQTFLQGLPVIPLPSTQNKKARIETRAADYEIGRIKIMHSQLELISEHINFGDDNYKNDVLDAIDIGCRLIPIVTKSAVVSGGVY